MKKKNGCPDGITGEFYPKFKEEIIAMLQKFLHKIKEEETLPN